MNNTMPWFTVLLLVCLLQGCDRPRSPHFTASEETSQLRDELRIAIRDQLPEYVGSWKNPVLLINDGSVASKELKLGQAVYHKRCVQCHGVNGDGNGPVGKSMYPKPRDYRKGIFKFTSTPYGAKPQRDDLVRTVRNGVRGTSMPAFKLLPENEIQAVVEYVLALTNRGELENQMYQLADFDEEVDPEIVSDELVPIIKQRWKQAQGSQVVPYTSEPNFTLDHVQRGKEAFLSKGCSKCHGDDGRGQTPDNLAGNLKDSWGEVTRAADLTSGMLHGGQRPIDIYRRIYSGINGTPMPSFANAFQNEPDTIWDLVAYVLHLSNSRRLGENHLPGPIAPYVPSSDDDASGAE